MSPLHAPYGPVDPQGQLQESGATSTLPPPASECPIWAEGNTVSEGHPLPWQYTPGPTSLSPIPVLWTGILHPAQSLSCPGRCVWLQLNSQHKMS